MRWRKVHGAELNLKHITSYLQNRKRKPENNNITNLPPPHNPESDNTRESQQFSIGVKQNQICNKKELV
jgi:hypothetical protein